MRVLTFEIPPELDGRRVKSVLHFQMKLPEHMISHIKWRETGITRNGVRCLTTDRVKAGDILAAEIGDDDTVSPFAPMAAPLDIVFEDADLLVLNKPAGMAVYGSQRADAPCTVANALAARGEGVFHPVNRLDRGTSGLMLVAKSGYVHDRLRQALHSEALHRSYLACAVGCVEPEAGRIELPILRLAGAPPRSIVSDEGAYARSDYERLAVQDGLSFLRVTLFTGRTHQIRVHFAALGHPLLGDALYGSASEAIARPALHSAFLRFTHPIRGEVLELSAPLPPDMQALWNQTKKPGRSV